jgi:hypothetical protein
MGTGARVEAAFRRLQQAHADFLTEVYDLDGSPEEVPDARPGRVAETFLRHKLHRPHPAADVRAAHALVEELPRLGKALAAGDVSREHVEVAVRTLRRIPAHLRDQNASTIDDWFTDASLTITPLDTEKLARRILQVLDPDGSSTFDPQAVDRRELSVTTDATGMVLIRGQLDPANGAAFKAAVDAFSAPAPADSSSELDIRDPRSKLQRQADAAGVMARLALRHAGTHRPETDRPKIVVHVPANESEQTGPLTPPWIARLACDSLIEAVDTSGLQLGRAVRTATPAQRRFLIARDQVCVIPGCPTPAAWCDAHHVQWWSQGGPTDVTNMAMVCGRHHTDIHAGTWTLQMIDNVPWVTPPPWMDRRQRPTRNSYREHRTRAEQLALRLTA